MTAPAPLPDLGPGPWWTSPQRGVHPAPIHAFCIARGEDTACLRYIPTADPNPMPRMHLLRWWKR